MTISEQDRQAQSGEQTRAALIHAALQLFGSKGFEATSTREIASRARANIGSIAYHFGNKEGLRLAAADYIVATIQDVAGQALGHYAVIDIPAETKESARQQLGLVLERMARFVVAQPAAGEIVQFLLRELAQPTAALDRIYSGVFEPTHKRLCAIWEVATGEPAESERTRLTVFTLIGQLVYFRIGREAVKRRMDWTLMGEAEAAAVAAIARQNLMAIFAARDAEQERAQR
ncbi:MAG: TetR family transcriptional regulator [Rhizobiales bacterium 63-22]|nr:CerR family C-terminal domain-containing protein [Alphaproteobacteria bacterium]OJY02947.1 MAG: TetR family transcriptional regulator [Rhizobiales bacterium 63-22]